MSDNEHIILKSMKPIVKGIARTFGKDCEVVLHGISGPHNSIVAIENSHVTGRVVGECNCDSNVERVKRGECKDEQLNYTKKTSNGRVLKSSTIVIRDENNKPIGCLCINFDLTAFIVVKNAINALTLTSDEIEENDDKEINHKSINEIMFSLVGEVLENCGKPVVYMTKEDKIDIVNQLSKKDLFLIKGAVDYVAKILCVSRYTIYNYLDEIRVSE